MRKKRTLDRFELLAEILRALAHPVRLRMLAGLSRQACNVNRLWRELKISQPLASQHLSRMRRAGLVKAQRRGQEICYRLADARIPKILRMLKTKSLVPR